MGRTSIQSLRRALPSWRRLRVRISKGRSWGEWWRTCTAGILGHLFKRKPWETSNIDHAIDMLRWDHEEIEFSKRVRYSILNYWRKANEKGLKTISRRA